PIDQRRIAQTEEAMSAGIGREVWNKLELVTFGQRDIPCDPPPKTAIVDGLAPVMPSEEHLDGQIAALRETTIQRHGILDGVRNDESKPMRRFPAVMRDRMHSMRAHPPTSTLRLRVETRVEQIGMTAGHGRRRIGPKVHLAVEPSPADD